MRRRRTATLRPNTTMNVTSLLDIVFVLLLTFMVVAPAMKSGVPLDLPRVRQAASLRQEKPLTVSVKPDGATSKVYFNGNEIDLEGLKSALETAKEKNPEVAVTLEGDRATDWEQVARVLHAIRSSGVRQIGILTKPDG